MPALTSTERSQVCRERKRAAAAQEEERKQRAVKEKRERKRLQKQAERARKKEQQQQERELERQQQQRQQQQEHTMNSNHAAQQGHATPNRREREEQWETPPARTRLLQPVTMPAMRTHQQGYVPQVLDFLHDQTRIVATMVGAPVAGSQLTTRDGGAPYSEGRRRPGLEAHTGGGWGPRSDGRHDHTAQTVVGTRAATDSTTAVCATRRLCTVRAVSMDTTTTWKDTKTARKNTARKDTTTARKGAPVIGARPRR